MRTLAIFIFTAVAAHADPQLSSWVTEYSSKYARIHRTDAERVSNTTYTTWTNTRLTQALPAYAGIQSITYSDNWIYFNTTDLGPYTMGPWYDNAARTIEFVNLPVNQNINYRIPRTSTLATPPTTKSSMKGPEDAVGFFVDGVALYDPTDGFSYSGGTEASPGTGQWHREAYANEAITFDAGNTHQQNTGKYHNHANPIALRYLLGDHIDLNPTTNTYAESTSAVTKHSPILGWIRDGLPIYGPYGYSSPLDPNSGIRRMVGGFVKRNGATTGVDNITTTGRTALPAWATRNNGNIAASGPAVSTTYPIGRYCEDWAYLGDLIKSGSTKYQLGTDFDLNEYNVRYCVTPEFPNGTYAYFVNLTAAGVPQFPCNTNFYFFGNATGGTATASETVTDYFKGGANVQEIASPPVVDTATGNVTLTWSSIEGGTYQVEASTDLAVWSTLTTTKAAASNAIDTSLVEPGAQATYPKRFYRVKRTALASYDNGTTTTTPGGSEGISSISPASGNRGTTVTLTITLNNSYSMAPPPANVAPTSITLTKNGATTITSATYSRNSSTGVVTASFTLPAGATVGSYTVNASFGPNTWSLTNGFTVN
jgi:hypothetical protein